jgi:hypothetical protein
MTDCMEHPFSASQKKPDYPIRRYEHNGVRGMATIWIKCADLCNQSAWSRADPEPSHQPQGTSDGGRFPDYSDAGSRATKYRVVATRRRSPAPVRMLVERGCHELTFNGAAD